MKSQIEGELTIGTLAALTGCKPETIRYYEQVGVLSKPARTEGGQRRYEREHHQRLNFVRRARDLGFPLEEVRGLLRLVDEPGHTCAEVEKVARKHLDGVQSRLADLRALEGVLLCRLSPSVAVAQFHSALSSRPSTEMATTSKVLRTTAEPSNARG